MVACRGDVQLWKGEGEVEGAHGFDTALLSIVPEIYYIM